MLVTHTTIVTGRPSGSNREKVKPCPSVSAAEELAYAGRVVEAAATMVNLELRSPTL
jgi:hypothetical protein